MLRDRKMKKLSLFTVTIFYALLAYSQTKYCMSYADFQEDKWNVLDTLYIKESSNARKFWTGADDFRLTTGNDSLDKMLKKEAFAVYYNDTLLINCRSIYYHGECFANGYTLGYTYGNGKLCIINRLIGDDSGGNVSTPWGGAIGGFLESAIASTNLRCYIIRREYESGRIEVQMIDDVFMEKFEKKSPEFYAEYMSVKKKHKRESAALLLPLLKNWQLIH